MSVARSIRWGGLELDDVQVATSRARAFVRQVPARGNGGRVDDRGAELREWRVTVHWTARGRDDDPEARYQALIERNDGRTRLLRLPGERAVPAKMSIESEDRSSGHTDVVLLFVEDRGESRPQATPGVTVQTAAQAVLERARAAEGVLRAEDMPTSLAADSAALALSWNAPGDTRTADISDGAGRQAEVVRASLTAPGAAGEPVPLDAYFALLDLAAALEDAAALADAALPGRISLQLEAPVTLLSLAASLYGAEVAEVRAIDIMRLNQLRSGNAVAPQTLILPGVGG